MMGDVYDITEYIKTLKRGFDKGLFQQNVEELAHIADSTGLEYDDFHTLFRVWLNLSIPITKWVSLGTCLVPQGVVTERTVDYAYRWLLNNCEICEQQGNFSRTAFVLDWLTAAMDNGAIDMAALDSGYEIFHTILSYEVLTAHVVKLVYTLTKPSDVTRRRVLELLAHAKKREGKKNMLRQIQVLLGLFKSYKPECVPEDIPAISVQTSFRKVNPVLMRRFELCRNRRDSSVQDRNHLMWINPINSMSGRNKKAAPLVPNMEFTKFGSNHYSDKEAQKTYFDFSDPSSLLQHSLRFPISRPARLRALLCNETGLALLALAPSSDHAFISHDLHHLLTNCFLGASPYSFGEKRDLLHRLAVLQSTLMQGVPVVTAFLARYLPLWNERDFFDEILELVEWLNVESPEQIAGIVEPLARAHHRAQPLEQCAILRSLTNLYANLVFSSTRTRQLFLGMGRITPNALPTVAACIAELSQKSLQVSPEDMRALHSAMTSAEAMARAELRHSVPLSTLPRPLPLALPLLTPSATLVDKVAALLMLYKKLFSMMKATNQLHNKETARDQRKMLESYTFDVINCLYHESAFDNRENGLIFNQLHPQLVEKLTDLVPQGDAMYSLRNHLAFAFYTYVSGVHSDATNKQYLETVLGHSFVNISVLLKKAVPELS